MTSALDRLRLAHRDYGDSNPGIMVALYPPEALARALARAGGEPVDELHVTVVYIGKRTEIGVDDAYPELERALVQTTPHHQPFEVRLTGAGLFRPSEQSDGKWPVVMMVNSQGLLDFREHLLREMAFQGVPWAKNFAYQPHLTVAYADRQLDAEMTAAVAKAGSGGWVADKVCAVIGPRKIEYPLGG